MSGMPLSPSLPQLLSGLCLAGLLSALPLSSSRAAATGAVDDGAEASIAEQVARCLKLRRDDPRAALAQADALLANPARLSPQEEIKTLSCRGQAASLLGDSELAVATAAQMEKWVDAHPDLSPDYRLRAYSQAGSFYHSVGQIHRAEAAYLRAHDIAGQLDEREAALTRSATLTNVGLIHADYLDSPDIADRYYRDALAAGATIGYEDPQLYYNHAVNLLRLGLQEEGLRTIDRGEAVAAREDNRIVVERMRSERAGVWIQQGQLARARPMLEQVLTAQRALPDPEGEALTLAKLSTLQRQAGERTQALHSAEAGWKLVEGTQQPHTQRQVLLAWIAAHAALGQAEQTLAVGRRLHDLETATAKQQRLDLLAELQARSDSAASQRELEHLRHESQIRALGEERSRLLRNSAIALLALVVIAAAGVALLQRRKNRQLRAMSATDPLTGLKNRRAATHALTALAQHESLPGTRHVLLLIDIDHFKQVNDSLGHHAGDNALVALSRRLREACRPGDIVARWGGEEFMVACADLTAAQACELAARLQAALGGVFELSPTHSWTLSVSLGFAPFPFFASAAAPAPAGDWGYALRMADRALYAAKDPRDAWVGFWGQALPATLSAEAVLEQPEDAVRAGAIDVMASYAVARAPG